MQQVRTDHPAPLPDAAVISMTRRKLKLQDDFHLWKAAEWNQLDKYFDQNMFGDPIPRPYDANVLPWVWAYKLKDDKPKARGTCNGGKRYGQAVTLAETYATCVEQPASRLFWALVAAECMIALGADAGNAFAEAPPHQGSLLYDRRRPVR